VIDSAPAIDVVDTLTVSGLEVCVRASGAVVVDDVSFAVRPGEVLGLVGESGSGKTTTLLAALGYARRGLRISGGRVSVAGLEMIAADGHLLQSVRGRDIAYVPQDPSSALNPTMRIGAQLRDAIRRDGGNPEKSAIAQRSAKLMADVGLPIDEQFLRRHPHQLSGGQRQRLTIAMAFACDPKAILLDEPTTGLDVTTQSLVLNTIGRLCVDRGVAAVYVSHDLAVVHKVASSVAVMYQGRIVEHGPVRQVLGAPKHLYSQALVRAVPTMKPTSDLLPVVATKPEVRPALAAEIKQARYGAVTVLSDVTLSLAAGECLAVVGESGSGKTTLARCVAGLHTDFDGQISHAGVPLARSPGKRSALQRLAIQYVFQNPHSSLNPRKTVSQTLQQPLRMRPDHKRADVRAQMVSALAEVSLPTELLNRYPDELSGGQRQRVALARALIANPDVLICDEVTSSLDVSVQALVVTLLRDLLCKRDLSIIFITHDLALASTISEQVIVLQSGNIVESGPTDDVINRPRDAYTRELISNVLTIPQTR
jgi:peptide/nickel transport system ATP-binding protein